MKSIAVLAVIGIAVAAFFAFNSTPNSEVEEEFRSFIEEYRRGYGSSDEYGYRLGVFRDNLKEYEELSRLNPEAIFGVTQFSDRTPEEMKAYMGYKAPVEREYTEEYTYDPNEVTGTYDWSSKMAPIKNQGQCGSCWAFSAVASVEARYHFLFLKKDKVETTFSEQQVVDCDTKSEGCNGGFEKNAFNYLKKPGFIKSSDYPYTARDGTCRDKSFKAVDTVKGIVSIKAGDYDGLIAAGQTAPISVAVDATRWSGYRGGVFSVCGRNLNHAVNLVGVDGNGDLKIRNSWGSSWGESGHIRLKKGNTCGVLDDAAYPTF